MRFQDIVQSSGVKSLDPSTRYKSLLPQHCRYLSDRGILPETRRQRPGSTVHARS